MTNLTEQDEGDWGEELVAVTDPRVAWAEHVRPQTWAYGFATIMVEDVGGGWVKVLWRCNRGDRPPDAYTMFQTDEKVWVR